jgi:hypothetical protein
MGGTFKWEIHKNVKKKKIGRLYWEICEKKKTVPPYSTLPYMGGVDKANQLRSYYERDQRSKKWWHRLFYSLLETTLVNSWICYKDLVKRNMANGDDKGKPHQLLPFKRSVTMGLLARGLNFEKQRAGRIGRLAPKIHPSAQIKN